ncbi:hypothetical protein Sjap_025368 [Stephania japonica]|uniref:Uncharacterized protein n=1 Tax=Stephania japonica TaxID=461633 RepID=A0AAP0HHH2_9MAGN
MVVASFIRFQSSPDHLSFSQSPLAIIPMPVPLIKSIRSSNCKFPSPSMSCLYTSKAVQTSDPVHKTSTSDRRSASYHPNIWDFEFIQSLKSDFKGEMYEKEMTKLGESVRHVLMNDLAGSLAQLELIEALQRLGIRHIFEKEIERILEMYSGASKNIERDQGLHAAALRFKLLREQGYHISTEDVFGVFKDKINYNCFKESSCEDEDVKGILTLYEASHFALEGENILEEAMVFTTKYLKEYCIKTPSDRCLAKLVNHSLELPLRWRMPRLEAKWYIEACADDKSFHPDVLNLAKLNFNMVQAAQHEELKELSSWWKNLDLASCVSFARDRHVENYLWVLGIIFDHQYSSCRIGLGKLVSFITPIDDTYDVFGSLDELELFTSVIESWDINAMGKLPNYMKLCFLALYNTINEMSYFFMKKHGLDPVYYLQKMWAGLCKRYLVEARWYHTKYTPSLEEYLENGFISITVPLLLLHTYVLLEEDISIETLEYLTTYPEIVRWSSMIVRLSDDLGTSTDELRRGDVPKSIQCYMHEKGVAEEIAREHIKNLISEAWKRLNKEQIENSLCPKALIDAAINFARTAQFFYQYGDGYGVSNGVIKGRVLELLAEPLVL